METRALSKVLVAVLNVAAVAAADPPATVVGRDKQRGADTEGYMMTSIGADIVVRLIRQSI